MFDPPVGSPRSVAPPRHLAHALAALAALAVGCVEPRALLLPDTPEVRAAKAMLLAWESPSGTVGITAIDLVAEGASPVAVRTTDTLTALVFAIGLDALHLDAGLITLPAASEPSRPLPPGALVYRAAPGDSASPRAWAAIDPADLGTALRRLRLPSLGPGACEEAGGCFRRVEDVEGCELPCDEPAPPAPPVAPALPALPAPAERPRFAPCPDGWAETSATSTATPSACEPPASLDATCPEGQWPDPSSIPAATTFVYAAPDAAPGGTGERDRPFAHVLDAVAALPRSGGVVVLARGAFAERVSLVRSAVIVGACPDGDGATSLAGLEVRAGTVHLANVRIDATETPALAAFGASSVLVLERVVVEGGENHANGLVVDDGGAAQATDLVLRETGRAIWVTGSGSRAEVSRLHVLEALRSAFYVQRGAGLTVEDAVVVDTGVRGVEARAARVRLSRVRFAGTALAGVRLTESATATITDVWIDDTKGEQALDVSGRSHLTADRVFVSSVIGTGLRVTSASARARDLVAHDVVATDAFTGEGLLVQNGTISAERVEVLRATGASIFVDGSGPPETTVLTDVDVRGTRTRGPATEPGHGLDVRGTGALTIARARIVDSATSGLEVTASQSAPGVQRLSDLTIDGTGGGGLVLRGSAAVHVARVFVARAAQEAVVSWGAAPLLEDVTVERSQFGVRYVGGSFELRRARVSDTRSVGLLGDSLVTGERPSIELEDLEVLRAGHFGLVVNESVGVVRRARFDGNVAVGACFDASDVELEDLVAERTVRPPEPFALCNDPQMSSDRAIGVSFRGRSDQSIIFYLEGSMSRFVARDNADVGIDVGPFSRLELRDGVVEGNPIGVTIRDQSPEDLSLDERVIYRNNDETLRVLPPGT